MRMTVYHTKTSSPTAAIYWNTIAMILAYGALAVIIFKMVIGTVMVVITTAIIPTLGDGQAGGDVGNTTIQI